MKTYRLSTGLALIPVNGAKPGESDLGHVLSSRKRCLGQRAKSFAELPVTGYDFRRTEAVIQTGAIEHQSVNARFKMTIEGLGLSPIGDLREGLCRADQFDFNEHPVRNVEVELVSHDETSCRGEGCITYDQIERSRTHTRLSQKISIEPQSNDGFAVKVAQ